LGIGVLVTRPALQAAPLCRLLEASGATVVALPAVDIEPTGEAAALAERLGGGDGFDLWVFTSANAVLFGTALLGMRRGAALAAIGPATSRALALAGHAVSIAPAGGFDSESLLLHPDLHSLQGRRVLIVTGKHGRSLLREELERRGALVTVADVYRREPSRHAAELLDSIAGRFAAGDIHLVTATSAEIAAALLEGATPALRREFARAVWVVPGARVATSLRALPLDVPVLQAASALDQDLLAAIVRWRATESGA
jgi:uroporphyrinogen-III synthase